jgi:hypothetical protein
MNENIRFVDVRPDLGIFGKTVNAKPGIPAEVQSLEWKNTMFVNTSLTVLKMLKSVY